MAKHKKRGPSKPHGMNFVEARKHENQVFSSIVEMAAQEKLIQRADNLQQQVIDAAFFAANDMFHMGPSRCEEFGQLILRYLHEIAALINADYEDDKDLVYAREKIDQRMRKICGDKFDPWDVRYKNMKE